MLNTLLESFDLKQREAFMELNSTSGSGPLVYVYQSVRSGRPARSSPRWESRIAIPLLNALIIVPAVPPPQIKMNTMTLCCIISCVPPPPPLFAHL